MQDEIATEFPFILRSSFIGYYVQDEDEDRIRQAVTEATRDR